MEKVLPDSVIYEYLSRKIVALDDLKFEEFVRRYVCSLPPIDGFPDDRWIESDRSLFPIFVANRYPEALPRMISPLKNVLNLMIAKARRQGGQWTPDTEADNIIGALLFIVVELKITSLSGLLANLKAVVNFKEDRKNELLAEGVSRLVECS